MTNHRLHYSNVNVLTIYLKPLLRDDGMLINSTPLPQAEQIKPWLDFLSTFIWQIIIIATLIYFRHQISKLISNVVKLKIGETEMTFTQPQSSSSVSPGGKAVDELEIIDPAGFFTMKGIKRLIADSGLIQTDEIVNGALLIFQTKKQQTWLISTNRQLFCILDDEDTRRSRKLIQWRISLDEAEPIIVRFYKPDVGLINIGKHENWLYSVRLHPIPNQLETEIHSLISQR